MLLQFTAFIQFLPGAKAYQSISDDVYEGRGSTSPRHDSERPFHSGREDLYIHIERRVTGADEVKNEPCLCIESDPKAFDAVSSGTGVFKPFDRVRLVQPAGRYAGTYVGRLAGVRANGQFDIKSAVVKSVPISRTLSLFREPRDRWL